MALSQAPGIINLTTTEEVQSLSDLLSPDLIRQAFSLTDTATLRKRKLPLESMVWLVIGMAIFNNKPMNHIVNLMDIVDRTDGHSPRPARSLPVEKHPVKTPSVSCLISLNNAGTKKPDIHSGMG